MRPAWRFDVGGQFRVGVGSHTATLTLTSHELVMEQGDELVAKTVRVWAESFKGTATALEFTIGGNLVVRDIDNNILWQTFTEGRGKVFKLEGSSKLEILDGSSRVIFSR